MAAEIPVLICPKCKSTKIAPHPKNGHKTEHGQVFEATYTRHICEKCGYTGNFFPEIQKFKQKVKKK